MAKRKLSQGNVLCWKLLDLLEFDYILLNVSFLNVLINLIPAITAIKREKRNGRTVQKSPKAMEQTAS